MGNDEILERMRGMPSETVSKFDAMKDPSSPHEFGQNDNHGAARNTDAHLWPIVSEEPFPDSIHVTADGGIGINVGGHVIVKTLRDWHALAAKEVVFPYPI